MANLQEGFLQAQAGLNLEIQKGVQMMEEALETLDFSLMQKASHHVRLHGGRSLSYHVKDAEKKFIQKLIEALKNDGFEVERGDRTTTFTLNHVPVFKLVNDDLCAIDMLKRAGRPLAPFEKRLKEVEEFVNDDIVHVKMGNKILENPLYILSSDYEKDASELSANRKIRLHERVLATLLVGLHPKSKQSVKDNAERYRRHAENLEETLQNLRDKEPLVRLQEENFPYVIEEAPKCLKKYNFGVMQ